MFLFNQAAAGKSNITTSVSTGFFCIFKGLCCDYKHISLTDQGKVVFIGFWSLQTEMWKFLTSLTKLSPYTQK